MPLMTPAVYLERLSFGTHYAGKWSVYWTSPGKAFVIIKKSSGSVYTRRGAAQRYVPVEYRLIDLAAPVNLKATGSSLYHWTPSKWIHEGKIDYVTIASWQGIAAETEKERARKCPRRTSKPGRRLINGTSCSYNLTRRKGYKKPV